MEVFIQHAPWHSGNRPANSANSILKTVFKSGYFRERHVFRILLVCLDLPSRSHNRSPVIFPGSRVFVCLARISNIRDIDIPEIPWIPKGLPEHSNTYACKGLLRPLLGMILGELDLDDICCRWAVVSAGGQTSSSEPVPTGSRMTSDEFHLNLGWES